MSMLWSSEQGAASEWASQGKSQSKTIDFISERTREDLQKPMKKCKDTKKTSIKSRQKKSCDGKENVLAYQTWWYMPLIQAQKQGQSPEDPLEDTEKLMLWSKQDTTHALALTELCRYRKEDHAGKRAYRSWLYER